MAVVPPLWRTVHCRLAELQEDWRALGECGGCCGQAGDVPIAYVTVTDEITVSDVTVINEMTDTGVMTVMDIRLLFFGAKSLKSLVWCRL